MSVASSNVFPHSVDPQHDGPDLLAGGVLTSLSRPWGDGGTWGPLRTLVFGGITFGVVPVVLWTKRFRHFVAVEQQLLWHLAEWMRLRTGTAEARELRDLSERIGFRRGLAMLSLVAVGAVVAAFVRRYGAGFDGSILLGATYYALPRGIARSLNLVIDRQYNYIWTIGLTLAYVLFAMQVHAHAGDVRRFVERFNQLTDAEGIAPLSVPARLGWGFRPLWIVAALVLLRFGAPWAIAMMLAGAVQRQYAARTSAGVRAGLAQQVRTLLTNDRPARQVPSPSISLRTCENPLCYATLAPDAAFCPRCGATRGARGGRSRVM